MTDVLNRERSLLSPSRGRRLAARVGLVAALIVTGCSSASSTSGSLLDHELRDGDQIVTIAQAGPGPYLINFWATYCEPCARELPLLAATAATTPEVTFVGVNVLDDDEAAAEMLAAAGVDYLSWSDPMGEVMRAFQVRSLPATFVLSSAGDVLGSRIGELDDADITELITAATASTP